VENQILLGHNDVLTLTISLMNDLKFRKISASRYPILLIDEYQDTDKKIVDSLKEHFIDQSIGPLIGCFGDLKLT
jgi:DNA helicase-2/ATP-dependent DNA helicase PcrA